MSAGQDARVQPRRRRPRQLPRDLVRARSPGSGGPFIPLVAAGAVVIQGGTLSVQVPAIPGFTAAGVMVFVQGATVDGLGRPVPDQRGHHPGRPVARPKSQRTLVGAFGAWSSCLDHAWGADRLDRTDPCSIRPSSGTRSSPASRWRRSRQPRLRNPTHRRRGFAPGARRLEGHARLRGRRGNLDLRLVQVLPRIRMSRDLRARRQRALHGPRFVQRQVDALSDDRRPRVAGAVVVPRCGPPAARQRDLHRRQARQRVPDRRPPRRGLRYIRDRAGSRVWRCTRSWAETSSIEARKRADRVHSLR